MNYLMIVCLNFFCCLNGLDFLFHILLALIFFGVFCKMEIFIYMLFLPNLVLNFFVDLILLIAYDGWEWLGSWNLLNGFYQPCARILCFIFYLTMTFCKCLFLSQMEILNVFGDRHYHLFLVRNLPNNYHHFIKWWSVLRI